MSDRIEPTFCPPSHAPWPEVTDASRRYDHGQPWCANAEGHPDHNDGYPNRDRHLPWHECRSVEAYVHGVSRGLDDEPVGLSAYAAAPFRFGQACGIAAAPPAGVVLEIWQSDGDQPAQRISVSPASALHLARVLVHLADMLTFVSSSA